MSEPRAPWLLRIQTGLTYAFLYAPILVLVAFSFNVDRRNAVWKGFTLEWYLKLLDNQALQRALQNSLTVALVSTLLAAVIGTMAALALTRYRFRGRELVGSFVYLPMTIPEVVMGTALLTFFVGAGVQLSIWTVMAAHVAFSVGYVTATIRSRLAGVDFTLEEAAADLGADPWTVFRLVTLPRILPGILSGGLLAFTLSFDDFVITFFTAGIGAATLPLKIYSMVKFGVTPEINAISTLMLVVTLGAVFLWSRLNR